MITTQRLNSLPVRSRQPSTRNEPWIWWTGPSPGWKRQRGAAANRRNFARAPLRGLMSQTRSGRSTMAQKGEQTHTSRLIRRRRPRHRWLETASMPSTGSPHLLRAPLSGTEERPRDDHQPMHGQSPGAEGPERDPAAPTCPPDPRDLNGAGGWTPTAGTSLRGRHPQRRGHSQVPRALIGGPHSPQPPLARNARGEAGGNP